MKNLTKLLITVAKIAVSLGIFAYIFYKLVNTQEKWDAFIEMLRQGKSWDLLAEGVVLMLTAIIITIVRWWYLVLALDIDLSLPASVRMGFLGLFFNFAPTGIAGGDLVKAWMLASEKPGNRAKALASVLVDRIIGLYVLFLVATAGVFFTGLWDLPSVALHRTCWGVIIVTLVSTVGIALVLLPGFLEGRLIRGLTQIPKIGGAIDSLLQAILIYRSKRLVLFWSSLMTVPVHCLLAISLFLLSLGLHFYDVSWRDYFAIYPVSSIAQTIPLPAGPAEAVIVFLYGEIATQHGMTEAIAGQQGFILALAYRLSTTLIAPIGAAYYFLGGRKEVSEVLHEAEEK